jgi:hypothetical protein
MNRRFFLLASLLVALATFALGTIASTSVASAHIDTCCVHIINNTDCHAIVCVTLPLSDSLRCIDVQAHTREHFRFLCDYTTHFGIYDVCGVFHRLHLNTPIRVPLRGGCCGIAELTIGTDGCYVITINPGMAPCPC